MEVKRNKHKNGDERIENETKKRKFNSTPGHKKKTVEGIGQKAVW
jgi:hypothetical protein